MVCNAGIALRSDGADVAEDDYRRLMAVNLDGVLFGAQAAARQMKARGKKSGSIVLMASMGGISGASMTVAYSTSKGGVVLMAKSLADAHGPDGIRVNAVAPGLVQTARIKALAQARGMGNSEHVAATPLRRLGEPDEIAKVVQFFASDLASYVTGQCLAVTGGLASVAC